MIHINRRNLVGLLVTEIVGSVAHWVPVLLTKLVSLLTSLVTDVLRWILKHVKSSYR